MCVMNITPHSFKAVSVCVCARARMRVRVRVERGSIGCGLQLITIEKCTWSGTKGSSVGAACFCVCSGSVSAAGLFLCLCVCVCFCVCVRACAHACACGCYKCAGGRLRLLHLWKVCAHVATACIREERQRPALLLLADDAHLGFCLSLSGLPWSLLRVRLLQMCRRPSADATSVNAFKRSLFPEPRRFLKKRQFR